ncbi:uncharacterized, partial [Tachysurus ichikawai]
LPTINAKQCTVAAAEGSVEPRQVELRNAERVCPVPAALPRSNVLGSHFWARGLWCNAGRGNSGTPGENMISEVMLTSREPLTPSPLSQSEGNGEASPGLKTRERLRGNHISTQ